MSNWVIQSFIYDFNPTIYNYIKFKWYHFRFCQKDDSTISPALYLDNLANEVEIELSNQTSVNKKTLNLAVIKRILQNKEQEELVQDKDKDVTGLYFRVRTYVIATHIYLEINHNELQYETLIRETAALKEFIVARFKASKISDRIADMKSLSYKKVLSAKNNEGPKGQLKPQLKQIAVNPAIFGADVSAFAADILQANFKN
jgi:hypothetical protein